MPKHVTYRTHDVQSGVTGKLSVTTGSVQVTGLDAAYRVHRC